MNLEELVSQKHINNELIKDFDGEDKLDVNINFVGKDIISELVACLKRNQIRYVKLKSGI